MGGVIYMHNGVGGPRRVGAYTNHFPSPNLSRLQRWEDENAVSWRRSQARTRVMTPRASCVFSAMLTGVGQKRHVCTVAQWHWAITDRLTPQLGHGRFTN